MTPTRSPGSWRRRHDRRRGRDRDGRPAGTGTPSRLDRARAVAATSRDRQVVAIARAHLAGDHDLVDALARDHLVDHPDSLIVAWIASDAGCRRAVRPGATGSEPGRTTPVVFQVSVLGPLEVRRDGQLVSRARAARRRSCWCAWPSMPACSFAPTGSSTTSGRPARVTTRRNTLQSKVAKLRRALGDPPVIVSGDGGYTLAVEPSDVDALAVLAHAAAAVASARRRRRPRRRRPVRVGVDAVPRRGAARRPATATGSTRTGPGSRRPGSTLVETQFSARLRLGDVGDVIGELEAAVATYPFQEGLGRC